MARYTGPKDKLSRRFGTPLFGTSKSIEQRAYPPGVHGVKNARKKLTIYSTGLIEKQKLRYTYGIMERQFRNYFVQAKEMDGVTGANLIKFLETRLDNVVFKLGLSSTRAGARQMVSHFHILVNGARVNIASYKLKIGDKIEVSPRASSRTLAARGIALSGARTIPAWLEWNADSMVGKVVRIPDGEDLITVSDPQKIVEFYSR